MDITLELIKKFLIAVVAVLGLLGLYLILTVGYFLYNLLAGHISIVVK